MFNWLSKLWRGGWERTGPLLPYIEEFRTTCIAWRAGKISAADAHEVFSRLHSAVFQRAFVRKEIQTQSAYDFFNLASEMANATSFDNPDKSIATIGLKLVDNHLGAVYFNRYWRKLVEKRGPIASFCLFKCQVCQRVAPEAGSAEFVDLGFMFCSRCGDLFEYSFWDVKLSDAAGKRQSSSFKSNYGDIHFRNCKCGGDLLTTARIHCPCVYCGAPSTQFEAKSPQDISNYQLSDFPEYIGMSSFQYLQSHKIHKLDDYVDRPKRKVTQYVEVDYEWKIAIPAAQLVDELGALGTLLRRHGAAGFAKGTEECQQLLKQDHKQGVEAVLEMYTGPAGLGEFTFAAEDVAKSFEGSVHDLNKEFTLLRSNIYRIAKRTSGELRKWEQFNKK